MNPRERRCTECGREVDRLHLSECAHKGSVDYGQTLPWRDK